MDMLADDSRQLTEGRGGTHPRMSPRQDLWGDESTMTNQLMEEFDRLPDDQVLVEENLRSSLETLGALAQSADEQMVRLSHCLFCSVMALLSLSHS